MGNVEEVLSSSIIAVFFTAFATSALMWYGCLSAALELFGPSRYQWDNGYFSLDIERRVKSVNTIFLNKAWEQVPDKLVLYDYIGLFRSGPIFEIGTLSLAIRRMPAFFETFPVILIDQGGTVRADIPFRRAESRYSMVLHLYFAGGILNATEYSTPSLVKDYARKAQFGQIFTFEKKTGGADGIHFHTQLSHSSFSLGICGMLVVLCSKIFGLDYALLLNHYIR